MTVGTLKNILNGLTSDLVLKVYVDGSGQEYSVTSVECVQLVNDDPIEVLLHVKDM